jgi:hypothetical protein
LSHADVREALLDWVRAHRRGPGDAALAADMPLLEGRLLTSLQLPELLLFIEHLSGRPLDVARIRPGAFASVAAIERHFFADDAP